MTRKKNKHGSKNYLAEELLGTFQCQNTMISSGPETEGN